MAEILKRALDEALTAAYAAELPDGTDEYVFSEAFEREMRVLIRKTDHPIRNSVRFLTAAACVAIAVGCAVLLPRFLSNPVPVGPSEEIPSVSEAVATEASVGSPAAVPDSAGMNGDDSVAAGSGNDDIADEAAGDEAVSGIAFPAGTVENSLETDRMTTEEPALEEDSPATESGDTEDIAEEDEDAADSEDDMELGPGNDTDMDLGTDSAEDDAAELEDDMEPGPGNDTDMDSDADSAEDDVDYDEPETDETNLPHIAERSVLSEEIETLLGCSLAESYMHSGWVMAGGKICELPVAEGISPDTYRDPAFAEQIGQAKRINPPESLGETLFWCNIGKEAPVSASVHETDISDRNRYDRLYFGKTDESIDEDEEALVVEPTETVYLEFYRNGVVAVLKEGYGGTAYYRLGGKALTKLTDRIESRFSLPEPKTVGDLRKQLGTAVNYVRVYVGIRGYYDCTLYGELSDGSFLSDLLRKYGKTALCEETHDGFAPVQVTVVSDKALRTEQFMFYADGTVRLSDGKAFAVDPSELRLILTEYCRQKELPAPMFYETLGEYLGDKNFTELSEARYYAGGGKDYLLPDDDALLRAAVAEVMNDSPLLPGESGVRSGAKETVELRVKGWSALVRLDREKIQIVGTGNIFRTPEGLYEKLCGIIREKGDCLPGEESSDDEADEDRDD